MGYAISKAVSGTSGSNAQLVLTVPANPDKTYRINAWHVHFQDGLTGTVITLGYTSSGNAVSLADRIGASAQAHFEGADLFCDANTAITLTVPAGGAGKISEAYLIYSEYGD